MNMISHAIKQPFVFATGLAALSHSTWALATLFAGKEPEQFTFAWFSWLAPALLIAFALDVGQIVTSAEIRAGQRTITKYFTFGIFAIATYFLQWLYIIHHIPALELSQGVRGEWHSVVLLLRDCAIWIIPALLPLSTLLYTFSSQADETTIEEPDRADETTIEAPIELTEPFYDDENGDYHQVAEPTKDYTVTCSKCGWSRTYATQKSANLGLNAHKCKANEFAHSNGVANILTEGD